VQQSSLACLLVRCSSCAQPHAMIEPGSGSTGWARCAVPQ